MRLLLCLVFLAPFSSAPCAELSYEGNPAYRSYELHRLDLMAGFVREDPIVFEAGGHYGDDTKKLAARWPKGLILSFEPNPHAFQKLEAATKTLPNVRRYPLAVGSQNGKVTFNICHGSTGDNAIYEGASSLLPASDWMAIHYQGPHITVESVILDDWGKNNSVDHVDLMWLDMEGYELQMLKSSPRILNRVKVIYTETNFREFRKGMTQYKDLKAFLEKSGFTLIAHWYSPTFQGDAIFIRL